MLPVTTLLQNTYLLVFIGSFFLNIQRKKRFRALKYSTRNCKWLEYSQLKPSNTKKMVNFPKTKKINI